MRRTAGVLLFGLLAICTAAQARIKLVALPEREATTVLLDNPAGTLVEEERTLALQKGVNKVDFSWKGVRIDPDSIRLAILSHPAEVKLLSVSFPPNEDALIWEIASPAAYQEKVRISYLLASIDRLVTYKMVSNADETKVDLKSFLVLRNFSGEDFSLATVGLDYGASARRSIQHEETSQTLLVERKGVPIEKKWVFDARKLPWEPEKLDQNVGIPVYYVVKNDRASGLGEFLLWGGKARVYQDDGNGSTIFLGEDSVPNVPVGGKAEIYIGDSRDIVVTQRKTRDQMINIRRNTANGIILYDTDEIIEATVENFKDRPAVLTLIEQIPGQWEMVETTHEYEKEDASTLKFTVKLAPKAKTAVMFHYHRRNVR